MTRMPAETRPFDPARYLDDEEAVASYAEAVLEDGDRALVIDAITTIARAVGMTFIAEAAGLPRESLFDAIVADEPDAAVAARILRILAERSVISPAAAE